MITSRLCRSVAALACLWVASTAFAAQPALVGAPQAVGWGPHGKKLYYFMVLSDSKPGMDAEFNRWYDRIHAPVMIESGDFVWAQRFMTSPVELGGGSEQLPKRQYLVIFAIETDDLAKVAADANRRLHLPRNVHGDAIDYKSLLSYTFEALGPPITQKQARRILAEETAAGRVPPAGASDSSAK